jgi:hypothetical protein
MNPAPRSLSFSLAGRYLAVFWDHDLEELREVERFVDDQAGICGVNYEPDPFRMLYYDSIEGYRAVHQSIIAFHYASGSSGQSSHRDRYKGHFVFRGDRLFIYRRR